MITSKKLFSAFVLILSTTQAYATCTSAQKHPEGKAENFNINRELAGFSEAKSQLSQLPAAQREVLKAALMVEMFAPNRPYDLKYSEEFLSSENFGNWFYGAAAAALGYTETETLQAAAIVLRGITPTILLASSVYLIFLVISA